MADPKDFRRGAPGADVYDPERGTAGGLKPAAPATTNVYVPPPKSTMTDDAVKALAGIEPALDHYFAKKTKEVSEQDLERGRQAALENALEMGEAVRQGKVAPNESKWFMKGYKAQYGENVGQQWALEAKTQWEQSEAKNSDDPKAVERFLLDFTQKKLQDPASRDPDVRAGLTPVLAKTRTALMAAQTEYTAAKVKETHLNNVGVAVSNDLDLYRSGRMTAEQLMASIQQKDGAAKLMGVDPVEFNKSIVAAVTNKARELNDPNLLKVLKSYQYIGNNPKYAGAIRTAEDAIISRSATMANLAYTQMMRQRAEQERVGMIKVYDMLLDQRKNGGEIRMTPEIELEMKKTGQPDAYTKTMAFINTMRGDGEHMSVDEINRLNQAIIAAGPNGLAALDYMAPSIKNERVYNQLRSIAQASTDLTNDRVFTDTTARIEKYAGQGEFGPTPIDPRARRDAIAEFRTQYVQWVARNPQTSPQERDAFALKLEQSVTDRLDKVKLFKPSDKYQGLPALTDQQLIELYNSTNKPKK
jgi:hypothetical protein